MTDEELNQIAIKIMELVHDLSDDEFNLVIFRVTGAW